MPILDFRRTSTAGHHKYFDRSSTSCVTWLELDCLWLLRQLRLVETMEWSDRSNDN